MDHGSRKITRKNNKLKKILESKMTPNYENPVVREVLKTLDKFEYGEQQVETDPENSQDNTELETRPSKVLQNNAKYSG